MNRKRITATVVEGRFKGEHGDREEVRDSESPLILRRSGNGEKAFIVRVRIGGKSIRLTWEQLPTADNIAEARKWALDTVNQTRQGIDPRKLADEAKAARFETVARAYLAKKSGLRTIRERTRIIERYAFPTLKDRRMDTIKRAEIADLLSHIPPVQSDHVLTIIRAVFDHYAAEHEAYASPLNREVVKRFKKTKAKEIARHHTLNDEEIRAFLKVTPSLGVGGAAARLLLLSAQRRSEVAEMKRENVGADGIWEITADKYKTKVPQFVPLSKTALEHVAAQNIKSGHLFPGRGEDTAFNSFSDLKEDLDAAMLAEMKRAAAERGDDPDKITLRPWRLHDLRRTARTLMSRAGVQPDTAERCLGHTLQGVRATYDRYSYEAQKREAFEALARQLELIANPPPPNVVPFKQAAE